MKNVLVSCGCAVLLAALVPAQDAQAQLARVRVIEEQEGDLRGAEQEYKKLLDSKDAGAVHAEAALRLGRMLWRLDKKDEGRAFLERAVAAGGKVGEEAQAVLQGQGPDSKQAQEIAQKAQDAILRLVGEKPSTGNAEEDLRWLGAPAVVEITRQLDERRAAAMEALGSLRKAIGDRPDGLRELLSGAYPTSNVTFRDQQRVQAVNKLARLLWSMGGSEAAAWLHAVSADADVQWRRVVAYGCDNANESLFSEVELRLGDADPDGVVSLFALSKYRGALPPLAAHLDAPVPAVRNQAWRCVESRSEWSSPGKWADDAMQLVEPALVRALGDNDPAVARSAFGLLCNKAVVTERGMALLLEWLPRVPVFLGAGNQAWVPVASAWRAAKALGPENPADGKDERRQFVANLAFASHAQRAGQPGASAQLLDLVELGYDGLAEGRLLSGAVNAATEDADLVRAAGLIERDTWPAHAVEALARRDLPSAALPGLRKRLPIVLERVPVQTREQQAVPMSRDQQQVAQEAMNLFTAIGRTGSPDAVPFLRETLQSRPDWADNGVAAAALLLSDKSPSPEVSSLLRELLVSTAVNAYQRNLVFAALAQRGDLEAIPLYPRAYELGLQPSVRAEQKLGQQIRGAECLCGTIRVMLPTGQQELRKLHGYDDAAITNAWRTLLASPALPDVLADVQQAVWPESVRLLVAETVAERFEKLLARIRTDNEALRHKQQGPNARSVGPNGASLERTLNLSPIVLTLGRDTPVDASDAAVRYRAAMLRLCSGDQGNDALNSLSPAAVKVMVDQLRPLLAGPNSYYAMRALRRANVPLTKDDLLTCLKSQGNRQAFVTELPPDVAPEIVRQVEAMLTGGNIELREAACAALGRFLAADSVAALLPLLRDPDQRIVAAATDALQKIRLYHEQKAFWDQFQQGVTTGREAATAKLLIQAKPGQPKEQRLLALRSLGALGAPEALPYLIEWTGDQDQELAQAARDAIGRIHQQAGVK